MCFSTAQLGIGPPPGPAPAAAAPSPAVHDPIMGPEAAASVVDKTYSIEALTACITSCASASDAQFLVADEDGRVVGYLHYDCQGPEPELHRIYVDPARKRGGIGSALLRELHARL